MKPRHIIHAALLGSAVLGSSIAIGIIAVLAAPATVPPGIPWASGILTHEEANSLAYLAFPQTYADMRGRYGQPAYRSSTADYYQVGNHWVAIAYNATNQATGFDFQN
jgi:hypothetical protein